MTSFERIIYGNSKDINFSKFNIGNLVKAVGEDLEEFGESGVQGVKVQEGEVTRLVTYEKSAKRTGEPYIQAGVSGSNLVVVIRDKKDPKFETIAVAVKGYKELRAKLATHTAAVTNLDKGDKVIDPAAARQANKFRTAVSDEGDANYGEMTGNIILCAHGRPAAVPSGRIIGDQLGKKTPEQIVELLTGDRDPKKRIGKDYDGKITLSGCFTASGGPEGSKQDDPFAAKVLQLLRKDGYSKAVVVGMPGPSITAKDGDTDSSGTRMKEGDKHVQGNAPTVEQYKQKVKLEKAVEDTANAYNALVDPYKAAKADFTAATQRVNQARNAQGAPQAGFVKATADLHTAKAKFEGLEARINTARAAYDKAVEALEKSGLAKTTAKLTGTFGLRSLN